MDFLSVMAASAMSAIRQSIDTFSPKRQSAFSALSSLDRCDSTSPEREKGIVLYVHCLFGYFSKNKKTSKTRNAPVEIKG